VGPWGDAVAVDRAVRGAVLEEAQRMVDVVQRVASPDAVADVVGDAWSVISGS
jgi:hypothetical protein